MASAKDLRYITYDEFQRILSNEQNKMYRVVYKTVWFLGLEITEALNIRRKDIDFDKNEVKIKGRYDRVRTIELHPDLKWDLLEYCKEGKFTDEKRIFNLDRSTTYLVLRKHGESIGKKNISIISFRRGFGKWFLSKGGDISKLQQIYGHSNQARTLEFLGMITYGSGQYKAVTLQTIDEKLSGKICEKCGQRIEKELRLAPEKRVVPGNLCRRCYHVEKQRREYANKKLGFLKYLGAKCVRCGFSDWRALEMDHKASDGVVDRHIRFKNQTSMYYYYLKHPEEAKQRLQLLCANCNAIKKFEAGEFRYRRFF